MSRPSGRSLAYWRNRLGFEEGDVWAAFVAEFRRWHRDPAAPHRRYTRIASPISQLRLWSMMRHEWGLTYWGAAAQGLLPGAKRWPADEDELREKLVAFNNVESGKFEANERIRQRRRDLAAEGRMNRRVKIARIEYIFHLPNSITRTVPYFHATHASAFEALTLRLCKEAGMADGDVEDVVRVAYRLEESDDLVELKLGHKTGDESWDILLRAIEGKGVWQGKLTEPIVLHIDIFVD